MSSETWGEIQKLNFFLVLEKTSWEKYFDYFSQKLF